jgi:phosphatidylinositol alpha-1,6-mannosyltransferase
MRLLILSTIDARDGDCETLVHHTARALAEEGHEVTVVAPSAPPYAGAEGGPRYVLYNGSVRCCRTGLLFLRALPHILRNHLVIAFTPTFGLRAAWLLRRLFYRPYAAVVFHHEFEHYRRRRLRAHCLRRLYRGATAVITLSGFSRKSLVAFGVAPALIATIRPGRLFPGAATGVSGAHPDLLHAEHVILSVAPFIAGAGQQQLIESLPAVLEEVPGTVLVLPGKGPTLHTCVRRARQLDVRDNVLFPGPLDDAHLAALYNACDIFALPAAQDAALAYGVGLALAEALAHGKPIVTDGMSGHGEFVQHGTTGLLVNGADPGAVAAALIRVLRDPAVAARMGRNAAQLAQEEFSWRRFARTLLAAVEERR